MGLEKRLVSSPAISVPALTMEGDTNGALHPLPETYARKFTGVSIGPSLAAPVPICNRRPCTILRKPSPTSRKSEWQRGYVKQAGSGRNNASGRLACASTAVLSLSICSDVSDHLGIVFGTPIAGSRA